MYYKEILNRECFKIIQSYALYKAYGEINTHKYIFNYSVDYFQYCKDSILKFYEDYESYKFKRVYALNNIESKILHIKDINTFDESNIADFIKIYNDIGYTYNKILNKNRDLFSMSNNDTILKFFFSNYEIKNDKEDPEFFNRKLNELSKNDIGNSLSNEISKLSEIDFAIRIFNKNNDDKLFQLNSMNNFSLTLNDTQLKKYMYLQQLDISTYLPYINESIELWKTYMSLLKDIFHNVDNNIVNSVIIRDLVKKYAFAHKDGDIEFEERKSKNEVNKKNIITKEKSYIFTSPKKI